MTHRLLRLLIQFGVVWVALVPCAEASPITLTNPDFSTGDLTGWTTFVTAGPGTIGTPAVVSFDVDGDSSASSAARFKVGQLAFAPSIQRGGGIFQSFTSRAGLVTFSADIAAQGLGSFANGSGGVFSLLVDGSPVDVHDFGSILPGTVERATLSASLVLSAGSHEIRFLMTRPFLGSGDTPYQYIDDVTIDTVPEPGTMVLLGIGLLASAAARRRRSRQN